MRVVFDPTFEEVVDLNVRFSQQTKTFQRQRQRSQIAAGVTFALVLLYLPIRDGSPLELVAIMAGIGIVGGACAAYAYGRYLVWYLRRNCRRLASETLPDKQRTVCEIELRSDGFWSRSFLGESLLPWRRLTRIREVQGDVELWFDPGLAIVRDRAFANDDERRRFIAIATELSGVTQ